MQSVSPVFTLEEVQFECEISTHKDQEYNPIIALPVTLKMVDKDDHTKMKEIPNWAIAVRLRLNDEERAQVAAGLDLVLTQLTFGERFHPMNLQFCHSATKPYLEAREIPPMPSEEGQKAEGTSNVVQMPAPVDNPDGPDIQAPEEQLCEDEGCPNAGTPHVCVDTNQTEQPAAGEDQSQS